MTAVPDDYRPRYARHRMANDFADDRKYVPYPRAYSKNPRDDNAEPIRPDEAPYYRYATSSRSPPLPPPPPSHPTPSSAPPVSYRYPTTYHPPPASGEYYEYSSVRDHRRPTSAMGATPNGGPHRPQLDIDESDALALNGADQYQFNHPRGVISSAGRYPTSPSSNRHPPARDAAAPPHPNWSGPGFYDAYGNNLGMFIPPEYLSAGGAHRPTSPNGRDADAASDGESSDDEHRRYAKRSYVPSYAESRRGYHSASHYHGHDDSDVEMDAEGSADENEPGYTASSYSAQRNGAHRPSSGSSHTGSREHSPHHPYMQDDLSDEASDAESDGSNYIEQGGSRTRSQLPQLKKTSSASSSGKTTTSSSGRKLKLKKTTKKRKSERFKCTEPWCNETFTRKNDVVRHLKNALVHRKDAGDIIDPDKKCRYCGADLSRSDAKVRHERVAACGKRAAAAIAAAAAKQQEESQKTRESSRLSGGTTVTSGST